MQSKFIFFDKRFDIGQPYFRLLMIIFIAALFAKGAVIFRGYAVDDYVFQSNNESTNLTVFFSQGRYILAAIVWIIESIGTNITDLYFSLGLATLFFQAAFIVSILRFVGVADTPSSGLVGAIMIAHPYLTEILTFRMALPGYSIALIFSIIALEMLTMKPASWGARVTALFATFAMLLTYQIFLNYFAVAIIFAFIYGQLFHKKNDKSLAVDNVYGVRAITLTLISTVSTVAFILVTWTCKAVGLTSGTSRASFITFDKIPERLEQISSSLVRIYWSAEPVFSGWLKILVALMLFISAIIIFWYLLTGKAKENSFRKVFFTFFAVILIVPVSLGVIIPFGDWWPVPRVIAHVAIIIGLLFLMADSCMKEPGNLFLKSLIFIFRIIVLVGFVFLSNQILADQQRVNQWDKMMANRLISRLEMHPHFRNVQFVHINGGSWGFPTKLRTNQGDMNMSAFFPAFSKVSLLVEGSGYRFEAATGLKAIVGKTYCEGKQPWPNAESITVVEDLAIFCLKK